MKRLVFVLWLAAIGQFSFSQSKKIINDYSDLQFALVSIKSEAQQYAVEIKGTWTIDSLIIDSKTRYINLKAAVDGVISQFQTIIRKPSLINETIKRSINDNLKDIRQKLQAFKASYIKGALIKANIKGIQKNDVTPAVTLLEAGLNLYTQIRSFVISQRESKAKQFQDICSLDSWANLK